MVGFIYFVFKGVTWRYYSIWAVHAASLAEKSSEEVGSFIFVSDLVSGGFGGKFVKFLGRLLAP